MKTLLRWVLIVFLALYVIDGIRTILHPPQPMTLGSEHPAVGVYAGRANETGAANVVIGVYAPKHLTEYAADCND